MIARVRGKLLEKTLDRAVVETRDGVAYELLVPASLPERLVIGQEVVLESVLVARDDALELFGFASARDRELFRRLRTVSGVGPRVALGILGALPAGRVVRAIRAKDYQTLQTVSGVGKKTAERIAIELTDKLDDLAGFEVAGSPDGVSASAVQALRGLGYGANESERAVQAAISAEGTPAGPEELVRRALQHV